MQIMQTYQTVSHSGYIAGSGDGIVTANGSPSSRKIFLLDVETLKVLKTTTSLENGHFIFIGLDPNRQFLVMCRDIKQTISSDTLAPFCWDYVEPATDKTVAEQKALYESWQQ